MPLLNEISIRNNYLNCCYCYNELQILRDIALVECHEPIEVRGMDFKVEEMLLSECEVKDAVMDFNDPTVNNAAFMRLSNIYMAIMFAKTVDEMF